MPRTCSKCNELTAEYLLSLPLFSGACEDVISSAIDRGELFCRTYSANEMIYSPEEGEKRLIIIRAGRANVYSADESRSLLLRTLEAGRTVGVANLFSDERFVSRVIADKRCETVEITADVFIKLLERDGALMRNYIAFLSNKICYLNRKIVCLTAGSAERRLAIFLDSHSRECGKDSFVLPIQMNELCDMLNLGRASLYRAADKLEADGCISRDGKQITIINKELMLSKYN